MNIKKVTTRKAWSDTDNKAILDLYFLFFEWQELDMTYTKAKHVRELAETLERSKGSIECKLMNISAIRAESGLDWVKGYKPLANYNKSLKTAYQEYSK